MLLLQLLFLRRVTRCHSDVIGCRWSEIRHELVSSSWKQREKVDADIDGGEVHTRLSAPPAMTPRKKKKSKKKRIRGCYLMALYKYVYYYYYYYY